MPMHDVVIRGATVVNGLGHDPIRADVAVKGGRIAAIGEVGKDASEIVDAGGLALMPGIIDLHTHYDAQVTWDPTLSPSPSLGVTTAIMGNCGFGIVPSPPHLRDLIMRPQLARATPGMTTEKPRQPFPPKPLAPAVDKRIIAVQLAPDLRPAIACFQQQYQPRAPSIVGSAAPPRRPLAQFHAFRFRQFNRALHERDHTTFLRVTTH